MSISLKNIDTEILSQAKWNSKKDDLIKLFDQLFSNSISHDMQIGYFTSEWIKRNSNGIGKFLINEGKARWIMSPNLNPDDLIKFENYENRSFDERSNIIESIISKNIDEVINSLSDNNKIILSLRELIENNKLKIRIAVPVKLPGLFHPKEHLFMDSEGCIVYLMGSGNATGAALTRNLDNFRLHTNFKKDSNHTDTSNQAAYIDNEQFCSLFNNEEEDLYQYTTKPLSQALKEKILTGERDNVFNKGDDSTTPSPLDSNSVSNLVIPEKYYKDSRYSEIQKKAIEACREKQYSIILEMATGTGKTITALMALSKYLEDKSANGTLVCISCPNEILVNQWVETIKECGVLSNEIYAFESSDKPSISDLNKQVMQFNDLRNFKVLIFKHEAIMNKQLQRWITKVASETFFIVDEIHRIMYNPQGLDLDIREFFLKLPNKVGLTATVSRRVYSDKIEDPDDFVKNYFGPESTVEIVNLYDAIHKYKILSPYVYHCINYELDDEEFLEALNLYKRIKPYTPINKEDNSYNHTSAIYALTQFIHGVKSKNEKLINHLKKYGVEKFGKTIFFIPGAHIEKLHNYFVENKIKFSHIDASTPKRERFSKLNQLEEGITQIITSHTILDEGINIPSINTAFITFAAREPRQGIQRRGRVLRLSDGKENADIFDLICNVDKNITKIVPKENKSAAQNFIEWMTTRENERKEEYEKSAMRVETY
jgi:superfamily II DNA or RNA helicase